MTINSNQIFAKSNEIIFPKKVIEVKPHEISKDLIRVPINFTFVVGGFTYGISGYLDVTVDMTGPKPKITVSQFHGVVCLHWTSFCNTFRATNIVHVNNDLTSISYTVVGSNQI